MSMQHRIFYTIRQYLYHFHLSPHRRPFQRPLPATGRKFRRHAVHRISGGRPDMESRKNYPQIIHSKFTIFSTMCPKLSTAFHRLFTCNSQEFHSFIHSNVKKHLKVTIRKSFCFMKFLMVLPGFQVFQPQKRGFFRRSPRASPALAPALP